MRHGSSCGCPDCMNANPEKFRNVGIAMPKPLKKAVEIVDAVKGGLTVPEGTRGVILMSVIGTDAEPPEARIAREISDAVRPLRDIARLISHDTNCSRHGAACNCHVAELRAALKEWEDME